MTVDKITVRLYTEYYLPLWCNWVTLHQLRDAERARAYVGAGARGAAAWRSRGGVGHQQRGHP